MQIQCYPVVRPLHLSPSSLARKPEVLRFCHLLVSIIYVLRALVRHLISVPGVRPPNFDIIDPWIVRQNQLALTVVVCSMLFCVVFLL